ncbi:MAG: transcription repressor NadR [Firmicutes bacterium]|nr:transcription repressor NadR [Bacillota bacterium]
MNAVERREEIIRLITTNDEPLSGSALAKKLNVSRQVIVQDIALLKAAGNEILSTNRGYILNDTASCTRVFKVYHTNEQTEDELTTIVDIGGTVLDVFVWHRVYGKIEAKLNISSRRNVRQCIDGLVSGKSTPLMNITSGYHYHTVKADSEETLDLIEKALEEKHYLAPEI